MTKTANVGIKVLDGTEDWVTTSGSGIYRLPGGASGRLADNSYAVICTHFRGVPASTSGLDMVYGDIRFGANTDNQYYDLYVKVNVPTVDALKNLLNDIRPIILYPLATPTVSSDTDTFLPFAPTVEASIPVTVSATEENVRIPFTVQHIEYNGTEVETGIPSYALTVQYSETNPPSGTSVSVSGNGTYELGSTVQAGISWSPSAAYEFRGWNDGVSGNPRNVTITGTQTITGQLRGKDYTVTAGRSPSNGGLVIPPSKTGVYGSTVKFTASPNPGYRFVRWNDGNTSNPRTVTITESKSYTAIFEVLPVTYVLVAAYGSDEYYPALYWMEISDDPEPIGPYNAGDTINFAFHQTITKDGQTYTFNRLEREDLSTGDMEVVSTSPICSYTIPTEGQEPQEYFTVFYEPAY